MSVCTKHYLGETACICMWKKKALRIRFLPVTLSFCLQDIVWGKDHSKSKVQRSNGRIWGKKTDIILRTWFPAWLYKTAFPVPSVYSTVQSLSDVSSPPLGSRTRRMEENAPTSITERPHTYRLSYLESMHVVLQGWERSTSASLGKDAKTLQVRH